MKQQMKATTMYPTALLPPSSTRNTRMSVADVAMETNIPRPPSKRRNFRPNCNRWWWSKTASL